MIADILASFGLTNYTIERHSDEGYDEHGRRVASVVTTLVIAAHMQALSGRKLERLAEGVDAQEVRVLWTTTLLRLPENGSLSDHLLVGGDVWEVHSREDWSSYGGFYKYMLQKRSPV